MGFWSTLKRWWSGDATGTESANTKAKDAAVLAQINAMVRQFIAQPPRLRPRPLDEVSGQMWSGGRSIFGSASQPGKLGWGVASISYMISVATDGAWRYSGMYEWRVDGTYERELEVYWASDTGFMEINPYEALRMTSEANGPSYVLRHMQGAINSWNTPQ